jgi:glycogen synthase
VTRILVVTSMYPPHHYGGYELSCRDVVTGLRARGHHVEVLTSNLRVAGVDETPDERATGVRRHLEIYWRDHVVLKPSLRRRLQIERHNQAALRTALEEVRPEVVSVWAMGAMSFGLLTTLAASDIPVLAYACDEWPYYGPHIDAWGAMFLDRPRAAALAHRLLGVAGPLPDIGQRFTWCFVSDTMRRHAIERSRFSFPDTTVVWSGIDTDDFPLPVASPETRPFGWHILYVGRIDPRKGIDTVVRALPLLEPAATLEVLGTGEQPELDRLHALVEQLGLAGRVTFGSVPRSALRARYAAADVAVFPSKWQEPFGLVPLEAMTCDTPVVATGTGGTGEFLADGVNMLLHAPGDHEGLAAAITRLAGDPELRRRLVLAGRKTAAELTNDRLVDVLERWHAAVADRFADGRPPDRPAPIPT